MPTSLATPITLPVNYGPGTLGPLQILRKIVFTVTGGVVAAQFGKLDQTGKPTFDQNEAYFPPGTWALDNIYGINLRSRSGASLATVDPVTGFFEEDPIPYAPGNVASTASVLLSTLNFQHNDLAVATEPTLDFEDSADGTFVWLVTDDPSHNRVKITPPNVDVVSVFGRTGVVVATSGDYTAAQVTNAADLSSAATQAFTGTVSAPKFTTTTFFQAITSGSATAFETSQSGDTNNRLILTSQPALSMGTGSAAVDTSLTRAGVGLFAQTATPATADNSTKLATTAYVQNQGYVTTTTAPVTSVFGRTGAVVATSGDYTAAQVTNAADKSSASTQTFTGDIISGTPTPLTIGSGPGTQMHTTGTFSSATSATTGAAFTTTVVGDTTDYRFKILVTGEERWAAANTAFDTAIARMAAGVLGSSSQVSFSTGPTTVNPSGSQTAGIIMSTNADLVGFAAANQTFIACALTTDASQFRYAVDYNGLQKWGAGGSTAPDLIQERATKGSDVGFDFSTGTAVGWAQFAGATYHGAAATFTTGGGVTWTPDYAAGNWQAANINVSGATTLTITTPTNEPPAGKTGFIIMLIENTGASGGTTLTWSGAFLNAFNSITKPTSVSFGTSILLFFVFNTLTLGWKCVAQY